jgi:flagellar motility protein MotE (MotC chaperone)
MSAKPDESGRKSKKRSKTFTIFMVILDIIIITAAFGAVFYFIFHNNIGGVTEKYYSTVKAIPLLNLALPEPPDPLNPKYMTQSEIRGKYIEFKNESEMLKEQLAQSNARADELKFYKDEYDRLTQEASKKLQDLDNREAAVEEKEKRLEELQKKLDELIASGDTEAFREYFESVDPENAAALYKEIIEKYQIDENVKKFAQVYAEMDEASAAAIFEQMGNSELEMIAETLQAMNRKDASEIIESMSPGFAARVTEKLNELYREGSKLIYGG